MSKLEEQIKANAPTVKTNSLSMSVGELASMYKDGELELHPEFQRFFRWSDEQKSRLIESMLLDIPVPPIFVSEREDAKWEVIDGLQRLSTIFEVMGELKNEEGSMKPSLTLTRTHYLPDLEGKRWATEPNDNALPDLARIKIKRARFDVNIVKSGSDVDVKYEIFQRLNTGGSKATDQEVRNCVMIMTDPTFFTWLQGMAKEPDYQTTLALTERAEDEAFELELVTRFVVFVSSKVSELRQIDELGAYLTNQSRTKAKDVAFDRDGIRRAFSGTFKFLAEACGENAFKRFDSNKDKYLGPSLASLFEALAIGLGRHLLLGGAHPAQHDFQRLHKTIWSKLGTQPYVGSGIRASTRIPGTISFGRKIFIPGWVDAE